MSKEKLVNVQLLVRGESIHVLQRRINEASDDGYRAVSITYGQGEWVALVEKQVKKYE